ncbi:MAG: sulfotransferase, partial [Phycisphaeraceae bacterium]
AIAIHRRMLNQKNSTVSRSMNKPNYAAIVGSGRSGTNWLLQMFNFSPRTLCRNEPVLVDGNPYTELFPEPELRPFAPERYADRWREGWNHAVLRTSTRMGDRDPRIGGPKDFVHEVSRGLGLAFLVQHHRTRRLLAAVLPVLRGGEWPIPWFLGSQRRLESTVAILKLPLTCGRYMLTERPGAPVLHIVRHPGGYLRSWRNRYVGPRDAERIAEANHRRLRAIVEHESAWAARIGDPDAATMEEAELWNWCYENETVHAAGVNRDTYHRIIYEQLVADPVGQMRDLYEVCGLPFTARVEQRILDASQSSGQIARQWRDKLSPEQIALVERILAQSSMRQWWDDAPDDYTEDAVHAA